MFHVLWHGALSNPVVSDSAGAGPFAAVYAPGGALIVVNAVSNTISSYQLDVNESLHIVSNALPTNGNASCWDVIARSGHSIYTDNPGDSTLSGFNIVLRLVKKAAILPR